MHQHPQLEKRDAVHIRNISVSARNIIHRNTYFPDYQVIEKYAAFPYIKYGKVVISGYVREIGDILSCQYIIPSSIMHFCEKYAFIEQDGVFQLAYFVMRILSNSRITQQYALGFSGNELIQELRGYVDKFAVMDDAEISTYCSLLMKAKYIRFIPTNYVFGGIYDNLFRFQDKYEFNSAKTELFTEYHKFRSVRDQMAWNVGSLVEIASSNDVWHKGQIIEISKERVTVVSYTSNGCLAKKTVDRFNSTKIRSRLSFNRSNWTENTEIELYNKWKHQWYKGVIAEVIIPNQNKSYIDKIKVIYDNDGVSDFKILPRWSYNVRDIKESTFYNGFKSGAKVTVYSHSKKRWISGHIKVTIPMVQCVVVKYGKSEKILNISSNELKLASK